MGEKACADRDKRRPNLKWNKGRDGLEQDLTQLILKRVKGLIDFLFLKRNNKSKFT